MTDYRNERRHLDAIVDDDTAPKLLRTAVARHLATYDKVVALKNDTLTHRRHLHDELAQARNNEPHRIVAALDGKGTMTIDEIGTTIDIIERTLKVTEMRADQARRAANAAWHHAERQPFIDAIDDALAWFASHRTKTSWEQPLPPHLEYAWRHAASNYLWHLPMVPKRHRFTRLNSTKTTEVMRRVWHLVGTDDLTRLDDDRGRHRYSVNVLWDDLLDEAD